MSRPRGPEGGPKDGPMDGDDRYVSRPGDEVVEPLFGALRSDPDPGAEPRQGPSPGLLARLRQMLRGKPAAGRRDWFVCPVCGAEVEVGAPSCRECGSDERTGWSEATAYDDLDLPTPEGPEIPDTFEEFTQASSPRRGVPPRLLLGLLAVALSLIVARAAQLIFAS